jgi:hypothetical protein
VLHPGGPGDLVRPEAVEELVLLPEREAVRVDPGSVDTAAERPAQVLLAILGALHQAHVGQRGELLGSGGLGVAGQDPDSVPSALG